MKLIDKDALVAEIKRKIRTEQGYSSGDAECGYRDCARDILSFIDSLQEEPVSEDLEEAAEEWDESLYRSDAFKAGAKWQREKDESITKDLGEYINELSKQFPEVSFAKLSRIAVRVAKWQKEQMMAKAVDGEVGYWNLRGLSVNVDLPSTVEEGDKVKVIVIKED